MKPVSNFLNRTPWWLLLGGGMVLFVALAIFTTPVHLMRLDESGKTPAENRAIKREIDAAFSEGAIDIARGVVKEMRDRTKDPARRQELERALEEIDDARANLREAGVEVLRAKRQAADDATQAVKEATAAIEEAQRQAAKAMKDAGVDDERVKQSLEESLKAAKEAQEEARRASAEARSQAQEKARQAREKARDAQALADKQMERGIDMAPPEPPAPPMHAGHPRILVMPPGGGDKPLIDIDADKGSVNIAPLPPELKQEIRRKVQGDVWRMGLGAGLILIFIPMFILVVVSKFFIDRSRASLRLAEMKRKEADYHRMSQQVTEAKLSALQAQVEPHFLYNTLASVQALTEVDPAQANAMTGHLIQYLRNALPKMRESVSTVGQEIELVRAYLNILQMRMGKRLAFEIAVPAELMDAPFPPLMLPSLVENAIKHGLEPQREGGMVTITANVEGGRLRLVVADTGRGFGDTLGSGVGLTNIRERLAALYGDAASLTLMANTPQGVVATIEVPRDGAPRVAAAANDAEPAAAVAAPEPRTATAKTLAAMGAAERTWRRGLTFTFMVLVIIAAVLAGLGIVGVSTGLFPVHMAGAEMGGPTGRLIGTAGIAAAFAVVVLGLAIVLAVVYGLGFLFVGLAIFIPLVVLVSLFPVLAPFILVGLGIWWLVRRSKQKSAAAAASAATPETAAPEVQTIRL
ncbi:MAG TPA: histidine kinase [Usitatibacter sp.]|nr:histidine kinase [Usitatibacter sp.]